MESIISPSPGATPYAEAQGLDPQHLVTRAGSSGQQQSEHESTHTQTHKQQTIITARTIAFASSAHFSDVIQHDSDPVEEVPHKQIHGRQLRE